MPNWCQRRAQRRSAAAGLHYGGGFFTDIIIKLSDFKHLAGRIPVKCPH